MLRDDNSLNKGKEVVTMSNSIYRYRVCKGLLLQGSVGKLNKAPRSTT